MNEDLKRLLQMARDGQSDEAILRNFGGAMVYVPSWKRVCRDEIIFQEFKQGFSAQSLAHKYGLTSGRIWAILRKQRQNQRNHAPTHCPMES